MALINIPTSGLWSSIAGALNSMFADLFGRTGWGSYIDTQYTSSNPFVVTAGTTVTLPNNAGAGITSQLPTDVPSGFYDGARIQGANVGDFYTLRVTIEAFSSVNEGSFAIGLDISAAGDNSDVIAGLAVRTVRGSGSANVQTYSLALPYFTFSTFVANGGRLTIESINGNTSIYDISYLIERTHKAR